MWLAVIQLLLAVVAVWTFRMLFDNPVGTLFNPAGERVGGSLIDAADGTGLSLQLVIALIALALFLLSVLLNLFSWIRGIDAEEARR